METSSKKLRKVCPQCSTTVHVKRAVCGCGYAFPSKRKQKAQSDYMLEVMKRKRVDRLRKANVRASETPEQTVKRQEEDKLCKARKRASETPEQMLQRKKKKRPYVM